VDENWDRFRAFDGRPIGEWTPIPLGVVQEDDEEVLPPSDFPHLATPVPLFSERAVAELKDLLTPAGQLLEVFHGGDRYYALNVTNLVDALDREKSRLKFFKNGRVMNIEHHEFIPERVVGQIVFKLPDAPDMDVYVTEVFVQAVRSLKLTGFAFEEAP